MGIEGYAGRARERERDAREMVLNLKLAVALQGRRRGRNVRFARESDYVM